LYNQLPGSTYSAGVICNNIQWCDRGECIESDIPGIWRSDEGISGRDCSAASISRSDHRAIEIVQCHARFNGRALHVQANQTVGSIAIDDGCCSKKRVEDPDSAGRGTVSCVNEPHGLL
jgi:hypothetical protein